MWRILSDSINYNMHLQQHSNLLHFAFHRQSSTLENIDSVLLSRSIRVHLKSGLGRTRTSGLNWLGASSNLILKRKDAVSHWVFCLRNNFLLPSQVFILLHLNFRGQVYMEMCVCFGLNY